MSNTEQVDRQRLVKKYTCKVETVTWLLYFVLLQRRHIDVAHDICVNAKETD
jgi:hypothetical protein